MQVAEALHGDLGEKAQRERWRFAYKTPIADAYVKLIRAMIPLQGGEVISGKAENTNDPVANARAIKSLMYYLGADMAGACEAKRYTWYSHHDDGTPIDIYHRSALVMLVAGKKLDPQAFIMVQVECLRAAVGGGTAVVALSGGVDSSVVTMLGHRALGPRLKAYFIENGIMREGEAKRIVETLRRERDEARVELKKTEDDFQSVFDSRDEVIRERERARQACNTYWHDLTRIALLCAQTDDEYPLKAVERTVRERDEARAEVERLRALVETVRGA